MTDVVVVGIGSEVNSEFLSALATGKPPRTIRVGCLLSTLNRTSPRLHVGKRVWSSGSDRTIVVSEALRSLGKT